jgi:hypothetical protein
MAMTDGSCWVSFLGFPSCCVDFETAGLFGIVLACYGVSVGAGKG